METVEIAISHTPWWVGVLFLFLLALGVRALWPRTTAFGQLALMPAIFLVWGLSNLFLTFRLTGLSIGLWALGIIAGTAVGLLLVRGLALRADHMHRLVRIPGTPVSLVVMLLIFATKYAFAYQIARNPELVLDPTFIALDLGVSGVLTGTLVGRFLGLWQKYRAAPQENLAPPRHATAH
jgi:hypothetical protein